MHIYLTLSVSELSVLEQHHTCATFCMCGHTHAPQVAAPLLVHRCGAHALQVWCVCVRERTQHLDCLSCSALQCVAVCCSALQYIAEHTTSRLFELQCVAVYCSVLQCVAVCCSVWQCVAVCCSVLQCVAVRCSILQSTQHLDS